MIIDGKQISAELKAEVAQRVAEAAAQYGRVPHLVVIRVGEDPASVVYVRNKAKACEACGIRNTTLVMDENTPEEVLLQKIAALNADSGVDGILVQLPLPRQISEAKVIAAIDRAKDVDGFHPLNVAGLWQKTPHMAPCTPKGILKLLSAAGVDPKGKRAVVIGRSNIVGLPVAKMLLDAPMDPEGLKDLVCSPGGSTIQGVRALENGAFRAAVIEAVIATFEKKF